MTARLIAFAVAAALLIAAPNADAVLIRLDNGSLHRDVLYAGPAANPTAYALTFHATILPGGFTKYVIRAERTAGTPGINSMLFDVTAPAGVQQVRRGSAPGVPTATNDFNAQLDADGGTHNIPPGLTSDYDTQFRISTSEFPGIIHCDPIPCPPLATEDEAGLHGFIILVGPNVKVQRDLAQIVVPDPDDGWLPGQTIFEFEILLGSAADDAEFRGQVVGVPAPAAGVIVCIGMAALLRSASRPRSRGRIPAALVAPAAALLIAAPSADAVLIRLDDGSLHRDSIVGGTDQPGSFTLTVRETDLAGGYVQYRFRVERPANVGGVNSLVLNITSPTSVQQVRSAFSPTAQTLSSDSNPIIDAGFGLPPGLTSAHDTQFPFTLPMVYFDCIEFDCSMYSPNNYEDDYGLHGLMIFTGPAVLRARDLAQVVVSLPEGGWSPRQTILNFEILIGAADDDVEFRGQVIGVPAPDAGMAVVCATMVVRRVQRRAGCGYSPAASRVS